jgi:hypothetical protein
MNIYLLVFAATVGSFVIGYLNGRADGIVEGRIQQFQRENR